MAEEDVDWTQVFDRVKGSIFSILFAPKQDQLEELKILADEVKTVKDKKSRYDKVRNGHSSTGFAYYSRPTGLLIMTSAHGLSYLFNASRPLTRETLDMMDITVLCDHQEETIQEGRLVNAVRKYGIATVAGVDSSEDTIVLSVENSSLKNYSDDGVCAQAHPALEISANTPINCRQCMMVSWPSNMPRMVSIGTTVSSRGIDMPDPLGYNMNVLEVDMRTAESSSGAPLFNSNGEVIGILQGRLSRTRSIFVAGSHLHGWVQVAHGA
ncbi:hypothetical protein CFC21_069698 [Triticum aestivum]|uniref:Uncharacterized protein n=3 Tax=Triticum TaxID=4564 RepID=A0A9R1KQZ8_WHEAT|nr:hypothetical protein CFC21_069697 [Triticum aestivum]KAF7063175.1 hypothetical protein CFC21_069698 [Triticum aestivum]VAI26778.1 unnamed protein product [Triticum turgidum subsp. durum]